ncbi:phenylacetate--CoA ligase family protein [Dactylosporangium sp. CA-139114]|uniref:phenylacetate--CoA ligase family protein n=1 Tax=Dactylosporangium sp. CA-139114 TaxID=3239931 RepID=UPI003D983F7D
MPEFTHDTLDAAGVARVRQLFTALRSVPGLAARYDGVAEPSTLRDLAAVPPMFKDDLQAALAHLEPRAEHATTWVFQSGGSTGAPQVGYAPTGLYMREVYEQWQPIGPGDVFVNGWSAGKMWGAHFLVNALTDHAHCTAMNLGAMTRDEYDPWLRFFAARRVTAFGGTPSVLRLIFGHARDTGVKLPDLRAVLYLGEAWNEQLDEDLAAVAPNARRWGMFGSTETWVVGTNTPDCPADTWHPLPSQLVCAGGGEDEMLDFTTLNPAGLNPVLRYRTGDAGRLVACPCGREGRAFQVLGRRDGLIKFRGHLVNVDDLVRDVATVAGVARAQLVVKEFTDRGSVLEVLVLPGGAPQAGLAEDVRRHLLGSAFGPSIVFQRNADALEVSVVEALVGNERTGKVPNLVRRPAA